MATLSKKTKTKTDDRISTIKSSAVYGVYHGPVLIYIGETTDHLPRRLDFHRARARDGKTSLIYSYIRERVDDPEKDLSIEALDYDDEQEAIDAHDGLLNTQDADPTEYDGHDWTSEELDVLEESTLREAAERTGASYNQCRKAKLKLGWMEHTEARRWTPEEEELLGTDTDAAVAEEIGRTRQAVALRRQQLGIEPANPRRKLTKRQIVQVYLEYALGEETHAGLADEYGVHPETIGRICRREAHTELVDYDALDETIEEVNELFDDGLSIDKKIGPTA